MSRKKISFRTVYNPEIGKKGLGEQLIIRVGKGCNFRCIFCNVAENESALSLKSSIKEILAITFYKIKFSKINGDHLNITISGGEPSIFQKETIFILKYFTTYFHNRGIHVSFDLQSNASNIGVEFAGKLAQLGVTQALISSHAHDPFIFEQIIGVKYNIMGPKFEAGVQNLIDAGIPVTFNIVLNKINKDHYFEHIVYLMEKYPSVELYNIGFVQPHGMAQENIDRLVVQYSEIHTIYSRVIAYLKSHGKKAHSHLVGPPLCYMDDWASSMEYMHNKNLIHQTNNDQTLIQSINDNNKVHPESCNRCMAKRVCSGVWKMYDGLQKLKPYAYLIYKDSQNIESESIISMKKLYDGGKRQFFLRYDLYTEKELLDIVKIMKSWGFIWISIIFFRGIENIQYDKFAGINFQILSSLDEARNAIYQIDQYNQTVSFQFRIQLDIIITDALPEGSFFLPNNGDIHIHIKRNLSKKRIVSPFVHYFS